MCAAGILAHGAALGVVVVQNGLVLPALAAVPLPVHGCSET